MTDPSTAMMKARNCSETSRGSRFASVFRKDRYMFVMNSFLIRYLPSPPDRSATSKIISRSSVRTDRKFAAENSFYSNIPHATLIPA